MPNPVISPFGENAISISWEAKVDEQIHQAILNYDQFLNAHFSHCILETVSTYHAIVVFLKQGISLRNCLIDFQKIDQNSLKMVTNEQFVWQIPVCYHPSFGLDLKTVEQYTGLAASEIISYHTKPLYRVYFTGFLPGFPYLGGLDEKLHTPRQTTPRLSVPQGAVGIGGNQTGIYPTESPGGWQIIGQSPTPLFNVKNNPPTLLNLGDKVEFLAITADEYADIQTKIAAGKYLPSKKRIDD